MSPTKTLDIYRQCPNQDTRNLSTMSPTKHSTSIDNVPTKTLDIYRQCPLPNHSTSIDNVPYQDTRHPSTMSPTKTLDIHRQCTLPGHSTSLNNVPYQDTRHPSTMSPTIAIAIPGEDPRKIAPLYILHLSQPTNILNPRTVSSI
ncbi:hypothetical protein LSAT2_001483 [Lamellibrachia satsuma]|nr:hypothetical protein LSAT2_001483 [Lamellibrachia satsuma]